MIKWLMTILAAYDFVQVFDYFMWGAGTGTDAIIFSVGFIFSVWYVWDLLKKEELENAGN